MRKTWQISSLLLPTFWSFPLSFRLFIRGIIASIIAVFYFFLILCPCLGFPQQLSAFFSRVKKRHFQGENEFKWWKCTILRIIYWYIIGLLLYYIDENKSLKIFFNQHFGSKLRIISRANINFRFWFNISLSISLWTTFNLADVQMFITSESGGCSILPQPINNHYWRTALHWWT